MLSVLILIKCLEQGEKRLPENISLWRLSSALYPNKMLSHPPLLLFSQLLNFRKGRHSHEIEEQYKNYVLLIRQTCYFQVAYFQTQQNFWSVAEGTRMLQEKTLLIRLLCVHSPGYLSISNTSIGGTNFLDCNFNKNKVKELNEAKMLDAL